MFVGIAVHLDFICLAFQKYKKFFVLPKKDEIILKIFFVSGGN